MSFLSALFGCSKQPAYPTDSFTTREGDELTFHFYAHASLAIEWREQLLYIDPVMEHADYKQLPKGAVVLITHHHSDHFDREAVDAVTAGGFIVYGAVLIPVVHHEPDAFGIHMVEEIQCPTVIKLNSAVANATICLVRCAFTREAFPQIREGEVADGGCISRERLYGFILVVHVDVQDKVLFVGVWNTVSAVAFGII